MLYNMLKQRALSDIILSSQVAKRVAPKFGELIMSAKKISPDVCLALGLVSGIAAGVMAAKAHKKRDEVMENVEEQIVTSNQVFVDDNTFNRQDRVEVMAPLYGEYVGLTIKLYGPAIGMGLLSVYLLLTSHGIVKGRNKALIASVQLLERGFSSYRERVREEIGESADERFFHGAEKRSITSVEPNEDGTKKKTKREHNAIPESPTLSMYSRMYDATSPEFSPDRELNLFYLQSTQTFFNDILTWKGFVMLNDVYKHLHMSETPEGQVVGWSLKAIKEIGGDDFIDFGLDKPINQQTGDNRFVLDFNVNGLVYEYI